MIKRFLVKLLVAVSPAVVILAIYFWQDPYKVLYHYNSFYTGDTRHTMTLCNDYVSTQSFLNHYTEEQYDSYIFGNSRSLFYSIEEWKKHINSDRCFHFDAQLEPLWGIERKLQFLHDRGVVVKNALFVIDQSVLQNKPSENFYFTIKHPAISGKSMFSFQWHFLKTYLDRNFLESYIPFLITHNEKYASFFLNIPLAYDPKHNELSYQEYERQITENPDSFYAARKNIFYKRDTIQKFSPPRIGEAQKSLLLSIHRMLDQDKTSYRIVINPLYDQVRLDTTDLKILKEIFGSRYVFDLSGRNEITGSKYNYYEASHYRSTAAARVMDIIYAGSQN